MGFWIFIFIMALFIPATMIGFGRYFLKTAPKNINTLFGYRTAMSMKNQDTWNFAHHYFGRLWFHWGIACVPLSVIPMLFVVGKGDGTVGLVGNIICFMQLALLIGAIIPTEKALKRNFDKNGKRK